MALGWPIAMKPGPEGGYVWASPSRGLMLSRRSTGSGPGQGGDYFRQRGSMCKGPEAGRVWLFPGTVRGQLE